jgi:hypothetical protein
MGLLSSVKFVATVSPVVEEPGPRTSFDVAGKLQKEKPAKSEIIDNPQENVRFFAGVVLFAGG